MSRFQLTNIILCVRLKKKSLFHTPSCSIQIVLKTYLVWQSHEEGIKKMQFMVQLVATKTMDGRDTSPTDGILPLFGS